ncbi:MAG: tetratricopeptide repeat protein [Pseudomonadota bacterium]
MNTIEENIAQAFQFHQNGDLNSADSKYQKLIATSPDHPVLNYLLGTLRYQLGDLAGAEAFLYKSIELDSSNPLAHSNLSLVLQDVGRPTDALAYSEQAIRLAPHNPESHNNHAALLLMLGKFSDGIISAREALRLNPDHASALANLGALLCEQKKYQDALPILKGAAAQDSGLIDVNVNLGKALTKLNQLTDAEEYIKHALSLEPNYIPALGALVTLRNLQGRFSESAAAALKIIVQIPTSVSAHASLLQNFVYANLVSAYEAVVSNLKREVGSEIVDKLPDANNVNMRMKNNDLTKMIKECKESLIALPENAAVHDCLATAELLQGNFIDGFKEYVWRFHPDGQLGPHSYDKSEWDGRFLKEEKLLIHGEQGYGDIIQFMRYFPDVQERCNQIIFLDAGRVIYDLCATEDDEENADLKNVDTQLEEHNSPSVLLEYDYQIPLLNLPKVFGTTIDTIPWHGPYLHATPKRSAKWAQRIGNSPGIKIGIVWAGNPNHKNDHNRSCRLRDFSQLAKIPGIRWFSLQKGHSVSQAQSLSVNMSIDVLDADIKDFSDTMAVIANLDLVISVDTSVVHLAGAMNIPVWTLLPLLPDWRWMLDRDDSPWYPSMRLFRQSNYNEWQGVFDNVEKALFDFVCQRENQLSIDQREQLRAYGLACGEKINESMVVLTSLLSDVNAADPETIKQAVSMAINCQYGANLLPLFEEASNSPALNGFACLLNYVGEHDRAFDNWYKGMSAPDADMCVFLACGEAYFDLKRYDDSVNIFRKALGLWPKAAELHVQLARALQNAGDQESALVSYQMALQIDSTHPRAMNNCAVLLIARGELQEAELLLQRFLRFNSNDAKGWGNLAHIQSLRKENRLALVFFERAIEINSALPHFYLGRCAVLLQLRRIDDAIADARQHIQLAPERSEGHGLLGNALWANNQFLDAVSACRRAIELDRNNANAHFILGLCYLTLGDYKNGWQEYEWRPKSANDLDHQYVIPRWDGSPLSGRRLLINAEQGLGDTIQFLRFLKLVQDEDVTIHCQNGLVRLLSASPLVKHVIEHENFDPEKQQEFDLHFPLLSLPYLFEQDEKKFGFTAPLFSIDSALIEHWRERLSSDDHFRVGFIWAGSTSHLMDTFRSLTLEAFAPLTKIQSVTFYSLQKGSPSNQAFSPPPGMQFVDLSPELHDFVDTAAIIMNLDLVITVDTAVAHLAGSLGRPVWTLIATKSDWRWQINREDTPWYPSMRLFRQRTEGDWTEVMTRVAAALRVLAKSFPKLEN